MPYQSRYFFVSFCVPNADSIITTPRIQFVPVMSETPHTSSMPSQSRYFFVSFCVPNADSLIPTPRIQFVLGDE